MRSLIVGLVFGSMALAAQTHAEDKSQYTLFNPTSRELMRGMSTDRPDKTESPYTVDAGHYQVELSFIDYEYDHDNPDDEEHRSAALGVAPINLKAGLLNNVDLQLILEPHTVQWENGIDKNRVTGFGDIQTRLKINLWGNDGGVTALAVMPFIKFPTNTNDLGNDDVEGGVIVPLGIELPAGWGMGLMSEFDFNHDSEESGYHTEYINTVTFSHGIVGELSGYVEFFSNVSSESKAKWVGTVDTGLTYAVSKDTQLDLGVNWGVTRSAPDVNPFCGLSMRY